ncbi:MAG: putative DNA binding domain-containing protein [Bacteroidales bacterium]|nr:putative DNA binding domain-containing protein [Bacteroidales bacterium]
MTTENLHKLLEKLLQTEGEQTWLEFKTNVAEKRASVTPKGIGEYISALSNGATISNNDFGYLILGIEDETQNIVGTNFKPSQFKIGNQDYELWLRVGIYPKINFEIFEFEYQSKQIVIFRMPAAVSQPVNFQKKPFIRINSQKTDLRNYPEYVRTIYNSLEDWSAKIIEHATVNNLDENAVQLALQKFKEKSRNQQFYSEIDNWDTITFLDKARITIDGKITNTAILLLGKPESIHYILPAVAEISWKLETEEKAYEHFAPPLLINTTNLLKQIRNVKYKFFPTDELLATEVNKYDTRVILEALHNAIAHQDYSANSRVLVIEKIDKLIFTNAGSFFDGSPEEYVLGEKTPEKYRNTWLTKAMVNLNMIDTVGYGIHTMYIEQRKRFFPLPDYSNSKDNKVILEIYGHAIDENYSLLLMNRSDLSLPSVILLDRVQKKLPIPQQEANNLRKEGLIEGRKPNYYVTAKIAEKTNIKADYIKTRGFDDKYFKDMIIEYLTKFKKASKSDIYELIYDKLPDILNDKQKLNKIKNLLYSLSKKEGRIINKGSNRIAKWELI